MPLPRAAGDRRGCTVLSVVLADSPETSTPIGTLTFLFTDIEESTRRWQQDADGMSAALAEHDRIVHDAVAAAGGTVFKHTGDGMCAVFRSAHAAVTAALTAQAKLSLPVRMGLHT